MNHESKKVKKTAFYRTRFKAFGLGVLTVLVILEVFLYVCGQYGKSPQAGDVHPMDNSGRPPFTILCLGNSFTQGAGAPPGQAYCDHLRRRLSSDPLFSQVTVQTINFGISAQNSSMVLGKMPLYLANGRPDLVLIMTGQPNEWDLSGYSSYLRRVSSSPSLLQQLAYGSYDLLNHSRLFRFIMMLGQGGYLDSRARLGEQSSTFPGVLRTDYHMLGYRWLAALTDRRMWSPNVVSPEQTDEALRSLTWLAENSPDNRSAASILKAKFHVFLGELELAAAWYKKGLEANGQHFSIEAFEDLSDLVKRNKAETKIFQDAFKLAQKTYPGDKTYRAALKYFRSLSVKPYADRSRPEKLRIIAELEALKQFKPENDRVSLELEMLYEDLSLWKDCLDSIEWLMRYNPLSARNSFSRLSTLSNSLPMEFRGRATSLANQYNTKFPEESHRTHILTRSDLDAWIKSDIIEIAKHLKMSHVDFIIQSYPPARHGIRMIDELLPKIVAEQGYPFSDTMTYLKSIFSQVGNSERYYSDMAGKEDEHLNSKGYDLIAELLVEDIKKFGFIPNKHNQ